MRCCCALQVYGLLQQHVERDAFLAQLAAAKAAQGAGVDGVAAGEHGNEVLREAWWQPPAGEAAPCDGSDAAAAAEGFTEAHSLLCW
jgi:hypothetical protein